MASENLTRPKLPRYHSVTGAEFRRTTELVRAHRQSHSMPDLGGRDVRDDVRLQLYRALPFVAVQGIDARRAIRPVVEEMDEVTQRDFLVLARRKQVPHRRRLKSYGKLSVEGDAVEDELRHDAVTPSLAWSALVACALQFLFGYGTAALNGLETTFQKSQFQWALATAAFALGGPLGAGVGGYVSNARGRRVALAADALLYVFGGALQCASLLTMGRFVTGSAAGFSSVLVPVYLGELGPPVLRATFGVFSQMALVLGILAANLANMLLSPDWVLGMSPLVALVAFGVGCLRAVESPRWLVDKRRPEDARRALATLRPDFDQRDLDNEIAHITDANDIHRTFRDSESALDDVSTAVHAVLLSSSADDDDDDQCQRDDGGGFEADDDHQQEVPSISKRKEKTKALRTALRRKTLAICLFYHVAQQLCGVNAVFYYSTMFFQDLLPDPRIATALVALVNVLSVYAAMVVMDHVGRKPLLALSSGGMLLSVVALTAVFLGAAPRLCGLLAVALYVVFFELGLGPIAWLVVPELFEPHHVDAAQSLCCQVNWLSNFAVGIAFPSLDANLGPFSFVPFAVVLLCTFLVTLLQFPETKDRSLDEIRAELLRDETCR